jgi:CRP-like cAMP-binding protein
MVYKEGTDPRDPNLSSKLAFAKFLGAGVGFGEIALLYNDKRTATIKSVDKCKCWALEGRVFKHIIIKATV